MSTNLAETMPIGLPDFASPEYEPQPRHIEIVSTRSQRRARPRPIYALIIVGGLFVLFIAQLLMSIVVSDGAYQISSLQTEQRTLTQTENALKEESNVRSSPPAVTKAAKKLGMVETPDTPNFLDLKTGKIIGNEKAAKHYEKLGATVVPNSLIDDAKKTSKSSSDDKNPANETPDLPAAASTTGTPSQLPAPTQ